jgi:hypothetical protein
MANATHPIWALARLTVVIVALTTILAMTAQRFDNTELQTILWMFLAVAGAEGIGQVVGKFAKPATKEP